MAEKSKVASWYWIITAVLTPGVLIACVLWAYYAQQVQTYRAEGNRLVANLEENHAQLNPLLTHMKDVANATGWKMNAEPTSGKDGMVGKVSTPQNFQNSEERAQPQDKRSPLLNAYIDAEGRFYGSESSAGYIHEYAAAREWLDEFEGKLERYIALKSYQYYTVKTINIGGQEAAAAAGNLSRQVTDPGDGIAVATESALNAAWEKYNGNLLPPDRSMQPPTRVTLEVVFRKQTRLIRDLVAVNLHHYNLLYADVSGMVTLKNDDDTDVSHWVGFQGEDKRLEKTLEDLVGLNGAVDRRKQDSIATLGEAKDAAENAKTETGAKVTRLEFMVVAGSGRIEELQNRFESEKLTHEGDAQQFEDLIRGLPRLKTPKKLEKSDPDGEITYSDYTRSMTHIDLGYSDGVRVGQRFEVWRRHGFEKDEFVGVIEIIRMLSAHYSLCTVLMQTNDDDPVRKGDQIMSKLWHDGEFLRVALHGNYEPPNEAYSKARLTALLEQLGVEVVEKVQPGTDVVILGSNLLGDEWYRRARSDLRFETLKEDDVRIYVDPR